ncbi:MAG: hypothetical protein IKX35_06675 [Bacteroidales bacterium]|nr:hypothetical protein [Bacteroidales bacterium]
MMKKPFWIIFLFFFEFASIQAQTYTNDFENLYTWYLPWLNLNPIADSTAQSLNHVCLCDTAHEFGLGFVIDAGKNYPRQNISCNYEFLFKAQTNTEAEIVFSIDDETGNRFWNAYKCRDLMCDTTEWSRIHLNLNFPFDYITENCKLKCYVWNKGKETLLFDDAKLEVKPMALPSYISEIEQDSSVGRFGIRRMATIVEYVNDRGDTINDPSIAEIIRFIGPSDPNLYEKGLGAGHRIYTETLFKEDVKLLRLAFVLPLPEGEITVYRRNQHVDTTNLQSSYYLDREGFAIKNDSMCLFTYHNTNISSLQLDVENRTACFNIDYWRDHPLLHYPMRTDTSDYFEDISYRNIKAGEVLKGNFCLFTVAPGDLPRLMPVWDGYQSAFIFTEHADWTDLRTHRAVLFGNENITKPEDAVGGFCYFNIPVTKSVFYWNPDNVTNEVASKGNFHGLVASIKTDKAFYKLLKSLKKEGFEICLHSPEVYTTIPSEFPKAMRFMKRHFGTVSWIDHGYNNGPEKNREDMVCDGLLSDSPQYAADLWKENGVRYLWNAYYEENRMERYNFDSHFVQPYDGFGDALPNRQITTLPDGGKDFLLWSTPSTLEVNEDKDWYYYFDSIRLQRLVDQHSVFITHTYPAWSDPYRGFWQYNENGTAVAMPGFNFALSQLAHFRDEKKILPTTIEKYLNYYESLLKVDYQIIDNHTISLINHGEAIKGLTLLCTKPIVVEGKPIDFRKVDEGYLVWFDLGKNETVTIRYKE